MKHARKVLVFLFLLVTPLLLAGILPLAIDDEIETVISPISIKVNVPSYEEQTPILAYNDFDMDNYASALSWDGNGSPDTPYIIDGYNITSDGTCIEIRHTTRAFEIRNCYLSSFSGSHGTGIDIRNVTQAAIVDTVVLNKDRPFDIYDTPAPYIENCTLHDSYLTFLSNCTGATITECDFYDNSNDELYLFQCNNSLISNNVITSSANGEGILVEESYYVTISGNHISNCQSSGIAVVDSPYVTIEENNIHDIMFFAGTPSGIRIENSAHASIVGNQIYDNVENGIYVLSSDWVYIFDNEIYGNEGNGVVASASDNGTISQNNIHTNGWDSDQYGGIYLSGTIDWVVSENSIWNNTINGITLTGSSQALIFDNEIFDNAYDGIRAENGAQNIILENQIHGNGWTVVDDWQGYGISFSGSVLDSRIEGNEIFNNTHYGIYAYGNRITIHGNKVYDHPEWGIAVIMASNDTVTENIVHNNAYGIFVYSIGTNVTDNIVFDNNWGIQLYGAGNCLLFGNDIGWNIVNAQANFSGSTNAWFDSVTETGNHWSDYSGSGLYGITNGTHVVLQDMFPSISLSLTQADPISFEILETENTMVWEAYALNPSHYEVFVDSESVLVETWDGNDIEFLADGLSHGLHTIEVEVYHISGHSTGNSTTADVEDLTPPSDIEGLSHIEITVGDAVSVQYSSDDPSGLGTWAVNDTTNFAIDASGHLTSLTDLVVGEYVVQISVSDTFGHITALDVTITVNALPGIPPAMLLVIGTGGGIAVLIVIIVILKKKGT